MNKWKIKRIVSVVLIVAMIFSSHAMSIFAEELSNLTLIKERTDAAPAEYMIQSERVSNIPEGDYVYFGAVMTNIQEGDAIYSLPIYREGDLDKVASISIISIDNSASYGKDYEFIESDDVTIMSVSSKETLIDKYMGNGALQAVDNSALKDIVDSGMINSYDDLNELVEEQVKAKEAEEAEEVEVSGFNGTEEVMDDEELSSASNTTKKENSNEDTEENTGNTNVEPENEPEDEPSDDEASPSETEEDDASDNGSKGKTSNEDEPAEDETASPSDVDEEIEDASPSETENKLTLGINLKEELLGDANSFRKAYDPMEKIDWSAYADVVFNAGEKEKILKFRVYDDKEEEGNESFEFMIAKTMNVYEYEPYIFDCQIIDDEEKSDAVVSFEKARYYSKNGKVTVKVVRKGREYAICDLNMVSVGGTAVPDTNYDEIYKVVTFDPNETEKEFTFDVYGKGEFDLLLRDHRACVAGNVSRTTVVVDEKARSKKSMLGAKWDSGQHHFSIVINGSTADRYQVQYDEKVEGGTVGRIFDTSVEPYVHVGDYYFYDNFTESSHWTNANYNNCSHENYLENSGDLKDGYLKLKFYHSSLSKQGYEERTATNKVPAIRYAQYIPDWEGLSDFCSGHLLKFMITTSHDTSQWTCKSRDGRSNAKFNRCVDDRCMISLDSSYDDAMLTMRIQAEDDKRWETPKSELKLYGVVALFKNFYITGTVPNKLTFVVGEGSMSTEPMYITPGSGIEGSREYEKYMYPNENQKESNLVMSFKNVQVNGHDGLFGIIAGYRLQIINADGSKPMAYYPEDFYKFLREKQKSDSSANFLRFDETTINNEIALASTSNLEYIPMTPHFIYWITQLSPGCVDKTKITMYSTPIIKHKDIKVHVLKPSYSTGHFLNATLSNVGDYTFHEGDTLNLRATADSADKQVVAYDLSHDGISFNTIRDTKDLFLSDDYLEYYIRPVIEDRVNYIEVKLASDEVKNIIDMDASGTIPLSVVQYTEFKNRYIYDVEGSTFTGTITERAYPALGKEYLFNFKVKAGVKPDEEGYFYRPVVIDNMTGYKYNASMYPHIARAELTDNVLTLDVEKVKESDINKYSISGTLYNLNPSLRDTGAELQRFVCSGYNVSVAGSFSTKSEIDTKNCQSNYNGNFILEDVLAKDGDVLPLYITNGFYNGQMSKISLNGPSGDISVGTIDIPYPYGAPKTTAVSYAYDNASLNMDINLSSKNVNVYDGKLILTFNVDAYDRNVEKLIVEVVSVGGATVEYIASESVANRIYKAEIPDMSANLYNGDKFYVKVVDEEKNTITTSTGTKDLDIIYPTIDTGLMCQVSSKEIQPKTFEVTQSDGAEQTEIPLLGPASAKSSGSAGALSMSKSDLCDDNNNPIGYVFTCNLGASYNKTAVNLQKQKLSKYENAVKDSQMANQQKALAQTQSGQMSTNELAGKQVTKNPNYDAEVAAQVKEIEQQMKGDENTIYNVSAESEDFAKANKYKSYEYIDQNGNEVLPDANAQGKNGSSLCTEALIDQDSTKASTAEEQKAIDKKAKDTADDNKENKDAASSLDYTDFTFSTTFVWSAEFIYSDKVKDFIMVNSTHSLGITINVDWTKYQTIHGVPCYINVNGTGQVETSEYMVYAEDIENAFTAHQFEDYTDNIAKLIGSNFVSTLTVMVAGKVSVGVGVKGVVSVGGYLDLSIQFVLKSVMGEGLEFDGSLIDSGGGIYIEIPVTKLTIDIARFKYGTGCYGDYTEFSFFGGLLKEREDYSNLESTMVGGKSLLGSDDSTRVKEIYEVLDNGETHGFETYNAGTSDFTGFSKISTKKLLGGTGDGKYGTYVGLLDKGKAADRLTHKIMKFSNGNDLLVFNGKGGDAPYNSFRLYYCYATGDESKPWSDPILVEADDGTFDIMPSITKYVDKTDGHEKAIIAWSDATEELTSSMNVGDRLAKLKISAAVYDSYDHSIEDIILNSRDQSYPTEEVDKFMANPYFVVSSDSNIYCFYSEGNAGAVSTVSDLIDPSIVRPRIYRKTYNPITKTLENKTKVFNIDGVDEIMTDYKMQSADIELTDGTTHTINALLTTAYSRGTTSDVDDATLYLTFTELASPSYLVDYKPIQITPYGVNATNPYLLIMNKNLYISYIEDGNKFAMMNASTYVDAIFSSPKSSYYLDSARNRDTGWYKKTATDLGMTVSHPDYGSGAPTEADEYAYYEYSPYERMYNGDFGIETTNFNNQAANKTALMQYGLCNDDENIYGVMIKEHDYEATQKGSNKELYCIRYTPTLDTDTRVSSDSTISTGFSKSMQISNWDEVVGEIFVMPKVVNGKITSYVTRHTEIVDNDGNLQIGGNKFGYYFFEPKSWMEITNDYVDIITNYDKDISGSDKAMANVTYTVKNTGVKKSKGFKTWIQVKNNSGAFETIYEQVFKASDSNCYLYDSGDEQDIKVNVLYNKNYTSRTFKVLVQNLADGTYKDTVEVTKTLDADKTVEIDESTITKTEDNNLKVTATLKNTGNTKHSAMKIKAKIIDVKGSVIRGVKFINFAALEPGDKGDINFEFTPHEVDFSYLGYLKLGIYDTSDDSCIGVIPYYARKPQLMKINSGATSLTLGKGESSKLEVSLMPFTNYATASQFSYSSSNQSVAVVGNDGTVRALQNGSATINVYYPVSNITGTINVKVGSDTPYVPGGGGSGGGGGGAVIGGNNNDLSPADFKGQQVYSMPASVPIEFNPITGKFMFAQVDALGNKTYVKNTFVLRTNEVGKQEVYYTDSNGGMVTGIQIVGNSAYYFSTDTANYGQMMRGFVKIGNETYYFDRDGHYADDPNRFARLNGA